MTRQGEECTISEGPRLKCHDTAHGIEVRQQKVQENSRNYKLEEGHTRKHTWCI